MPRLSSVVVGFALASFAGVGTSCSCTPKPETASSPVRANSSMVTGFLNKEITVAGSTYRYVVYVPRSLDASSPAPAIVFLHGSGECGTDGWLQVGQGLGAAIMHDPAAWPFIVVLPQKPERGKQWEDYDAAVMAMLDATRREYRIDSSRIYLTGLSQGGHGTWTLGANHPEVWAALAPICGYGSAVHSGPPTVPADVVERIKNLPIWAFHGEADHVVDPAHTTRIVAALRTAGADVKVTLYPGVDHNSWDKAYREEHLGAWLLSQRRTDQSAQVR